MAEGVLKSSGAVREGSKWSRYAVPGLSPSIDELSKIFDAPQYLPLLRQITQSSAFQRLKDIRFLGAIDYLVSPNGSAKHRRHTRFEHSLYVAKLAREYARIYALSELDEKHLVISALLHDIGHGPLSHSLEPVFKERFHIAHHNATELIIRGHVPVGHDLPLIFKRHGLSMGEVIALISGRSTKHYGEALKAPINIDTIEAISRAYSYIAQNKTPASPTRVLQAVIDLGNQSELILDGFWRLKDLVYRELINSKAGIVADHICREYMRRNSNRFWSGNYFISETEFRKEHPRLFVYLKQLRTSPHSILAGSDEVIECEKRSFYIDASCPLRDPKSLYSRYRQSRTYTSIRVGSVFLSTNTLVGAAGQAFERVELFPTDKIDNE